MEIKREKYIQTNLEEIQETLKKMPSSTKEKCKEILKIQTEIDYKNERDLR